MGDYINHHCIICGKGYHSCDSCNEIKSFTPWRTLTDTIEHFQLYNVLQDYVTKRITKFEARKELDKFNLSDKDSFTESAKNCIDEILKVKLYKDSKETNTKSVLNKNTK